MRVFQYTPVMFCHLFSNSSTVTETRWTFSIHNHAALAISIWPLKSATDGNYSRTIGNLVRLFCLMPFLKETRVTQSAGLLTSPLEKLRVAFLYIHQKEPPFPHLTAQDATELSDSYREISGPCCGADKRSVSAHTLEAKTMIPAHKHGFRFLSSGNLLVTIIPNHTCKDIKINAQKRVTMSINTKHISYRNP